MRHIVVLFTLVGLLGGTSTASATSITLDVASAVSGSAPTGALPWATVTFVSGADCAPPLCATGSTNQVGMTITVGAIGAGQYLGALYISTLLEVSNLNLAFVTLAATNNNATVSFGSNAFQAFSGSGLFDIQVDLPPPPGDAAATLTSGESISLRFTRNSAGTLDASNFLTPAAGGPGYLVLASFGSANGTIGFAAGNVAVPEPASTLLLGAALAGLVSRRRRPSAGR